MENRHTHSDKDNRATWRETLVVTSLIGVFLYLLCASFTKNNVVLAEWYKVFSFIAIILIQRFVRQIQTDKQHIPHDPIA